MFRIVCDPSSGSTELCLAEITHGGSQIFFVCLVGVWQCNFEPAVCVHGMTGWEPRFPACDTAELCVITQAELTYLVRDMDLPRTWAQLLESWLQQWNILEKGVWYHCIGRGSQT
jgi:hypothetical protein